MSEQSPEYISSDAKPLPSAVALSRALKEIETDLWPQNDTIDRAGRLIVEQWGLICDLYNSLQELIPLARQQGWSGAAFDRAEAAADKANQALS